MKRSAPWPGAACVELQRHNSIKHRVRDDGDAILGSPLSIVTEFVPHGLCHADETVDDPSLNLEPEMIGLARAATACLRAPRSLLILATIGGQRLLPSSSFIATTTTA
jgi:hypothetical protein